MAKWLSKEEKRVKTYRFENNWLVDIVKTTNQFLEIMYEVWLYLENHGVKYYMYGFKAENIHGREELLDIIERNIDAHKKIYWDLYIQEGEPEDFM